MQRFPRLGRAHPEIAPTARVHPVERWLILYEIEGGAVVVRRVYDSRRDPAGFQP